MLTEAHGNLLAADVEALINTVNTVGVMGKGIALQFKRAFPENFKAYEAACKKKQVKIGEIFVHEIDALEGPRYILNFPTKSHWKANSRLADIEAGLVALRETIINLGIKSVAIPPLGCGNGGLDWRDVRPLIERMLGDLEGVHLLIFSPEGAPKAADMPVRTRRPSMTQRRAALLLALDRYLNRSLGAGLAEDRTLSLLEVQKTAYFLQLSGWNSNWNFVRGIYGPYAKELDQFVSSVEGHLLHGFGDGSIGSRATLEIDDRGLADARRVMEREAEYWRVLERFEKLVEGFEYPYGIELLSTVHYVSTEGMQNNSVNAEYITNKVQSWSPRKRRLFKPTHLIAAYRHLTALNVLGRSVASESG